MKHMGSCGLLDKFTVFFLRVFEKQLHLIKSIGNYIFFKDSSGGIFIKYVLYPLGMPIIKF